MTEFELTENGKSPLDHEVQVFQSEMPPTACLCLRKAFHPKSKKHISFDARLKAFYDAYLDIIQFTFCAGIAVITACLTDEKSRVDFLDKLLTDKDVTVENKSDDQWQDLALRVLPNYIIDCFGNELENKKEVPQILKDIYEAGMKKNEMKRIFQFRDAEINIKSSIQETGDADFRNQEDQIREQINCYFGYWRAYGVGYLGVTQDDPEQQNMINFEKNFRHSPLPGSFIADHINNKNLEKKVFFSNFDDSNGRLAFLVGEREQTLWCISPFIIFTHLKRVDNRKNSSDLDGTKPKSTYRYIDIEGNQKKTKWFSRLVNPGDKNVIYWDKSNDELKSDTVSIPKAFELKEEGMAFILNLNTINLQEFKFNLEHSHKELKSKEFEAVGKDDDKYKDSIDCRGFKPVIDDLGPSFVLKVKIKADNATDQKVFAAKIMRDKHDIFSVVNFNKEKEFLKLEGKKRRYIPQWWGDGKIDNPDSKWHESPFYLMDYMETNARQLVRRNKTGHSVKDEIEQKRFFGWQKEELQSLLILKKVERALYISERIAVTLCSIYDDTSRTITHKGQSKEIHFLHRDIKPENLLYAGGGKILVCDFGSAFFPGEAGDDPVDFGDETKAYDYIYHSRLTRQYCAPEIWVRPTLFSPTADVFSVGLVLDELLFGKPHDTQKTAREIGYLVDNASIELKDIPFFTSPKSIEKKIVKEFNEFFNKQAEKMGLKFNLEDIVKYATAPPAMRWSMEKFRNEVNKAGQAIRAFIAKKCKDKIKEVVDSKEEGNLLHALNFVNTALGRKFEDRKRLRMISCELCHIKKDHGEQLVDSKKCKCDVTKAKELLAEIKGKIDNCDTEGESIWLINENDAYDILESTGNLFSLCPGLIDLFPEDALYRTEMNSKSPHEEFDESSEEWLKHVASDTIMIYTPPPKVIYPPISEKSLAEELLFLFPPGLNNFIPKN